MNLDFMGLNLIEFYGVTMSSYNNALSPLLGAASARLGSSSLEQQDATIG